MLVYSVGYMGVGKTTIGKKLARVLDAQFIDLDQYIENQQKTTISDLMAHHGEAHFRDLEKQAIQALSNQTSAVISTGGGAPCYNNVMDTLLNNGVVVWLKMPQGAIVNRLQHSKNRPLIANKSLEELTEFIATHYAEREPIYAKAHITFDALNVNPEKLKALADQVLTYAK